MLVFLEMILEKIFQFCIFFMACCYIPKSSFKQMSEAWDLFAFLLRSALLHCLLFPLYDLVCSLSHGYVHVIEVTSYLPFGTRMC